MGLFDKRPAPSSMPVPQSNAPDYTIETVRSHLESIGMSRLSVRSAEMKVLLSQIAWHGEEYLMRRSPNGQPSGAKIVEFCKQLETIERIIGEFQKLEDKPSDPPNNIELRVQGETAVKKFAARLSNIAPPPGGSANVTGYVVDLQILSM